MALILLLNGPNLNLLGSREPETYGNASLSDIVDALQQQAKTAEHDLDHFQSNAEHELIDRIHQAKIDAVDFIIINPAALTHTSIALRDAFLAVDIPFIEMHLSNIFQRETFRHVSYLADIAQGTIGGFGPITYSLALQAAISHCESSTGV